MTRRVIARLLRITRLSVLALMLLLPISLLASEESADKISKAELHEAISASGGYLARQVCDDGTFVYHVNMNPALGLRPLYSWTRHAAAVHVLVEYYRWSGNETLVPLISRAVDAMRSESIAKVEELDNASTLWEDGRSLDIGEQRISISGGAGLALLAMADQNSIRPGSVPRSELVAIGNFILAMQKPAGDFYPSFIPDKGGQSEDWQSLYNTGEAVLGLIALYESGGDHRWLEAARRSLEYLAGSREGIAQAPADHWALIATKKIWPHLDEQARSRMKTHARQVVDTMLGEQVLDQNHARGAFSNDGLTTPTATHLEGLLSVEFLFRGDTEFNRRLTLAIDRGIQYLLNAQVKAGPFKGALPHSIAMMAPDQPGAPLYNRRATIVRIDYVQHALSAFLQYDAFRFAEKRRGVE